MAERETISLACSTLEPPPQKGRNQKENGEEPEKLVGHDESDICVESKGNHAYLRKSAGGCAQEARE